MRGTKERKQTRKTVYIPCNSIQVTSGLYVMRGKTIRKGNSWVIVGVRVRALAVECDEKALG